MTVDEFTSPIQYYIDDEYIHVQVHFLEYIGDYEFSFEIKVVEPPVIKEIKPKGPWFYDSPGSEYDNYHPGEVITIIGNKLNLDPTSTITIGGKPIGPVAYSDSGSIVVVLPRGTQPGLLQVITQEGDSVPFNIPNIGERTFEDAAERTCVSWGDPHFTKYNGDVFHFQGRGEYLLASVGGVTVQSRQIPCGATVTCNTAVVVRYGNNYFEVNSDQVQLHTYVNKVREEIILSTFTVAQNFNVTRVSRYEYIIRAPFVQVRAIFTPWVDLYVTTYPVSFPVGTTTKGLCGGLNMQWAFGNETTAPDALTQEFINEYGESWRVTPTTSNFYYPPSTDYDDYNDPSVVLPVDEPTYNDTKAVNLCNLIVFGAEGNLAEQCTNVPQVGYYYYACLQDAAITGDYATVENSIAAFAKACSDIKNGDIGSNIPILGSRSIATGPGVQPNGVAAGVETYFTITARDALDRVIDGGLSDGDFEVTIVGPGGVVVVASIRLANANGYVDYLAPTPGQYNVTVVYTPTSAPIMGSPFIVNVGSEANCVSWGDPHFTTYTGVAYDFQGFGEYVLVNASGVEIQVRQEPCGRGVTCNYAIAAKDQTNTIALYSKNNVITSYIDNTIFTPNSTTGLIRKVSSYEYQFIFPDRFKVVIRNYGRLDVTVYMNTTTQDFAIVGGLCGIENKDWKFSNGQIYNFVSTTRTSQFLNSFGESWRVTPAQSLFDYGVTNSSYPVQNPTDYVPTDEIEPSEEPVCDELSTGLSADQCREYVDPTPYYDTCLFDVTATGNTSMAYASIIAYATICTNVIGSPRVYPTIADHSYAEGPGIEPTGITPLEPIGFTVYAIDAIGNPQSNGATDNVQVRLVQSPSGNLSEIEFSVSKFNSYIYNVTYTGRRPGVSVIEILINGEHIRGSPFAITFGPFVPSAPNSDAYGPGIGEDGAVYASFETHFVITARNRIDDLTFGATFTISSADVASFSQTDNGDGTYLVVYTTPVVAGDISISVTFNGADIIGSPFAVSVKELKPTVTCISWGDPHFTMFGSRVFNFQGFGEYILARIGGLEVQVRQATCNPGVTCNFAIAGREGETTLALYLKNRVVSAYVNGEHTTNLSSSSALNTVSQQNTYQYSLTFPSAVVQVRSYSTRLDFTVVTDCNGTYPSNPLNGGLCGEWNGFLPLSNGTRFSGKITQKHIDAFGESWRVPNAGQSFFDYTNSSFIENNPTTFVPNYNQTTENPVVLDEVDIVCSELKNGSAMVEVCKDFVNPTPFYEACKFDIIASSGKGIEGQASVVTYASLCQHAIANNSNVPSIPFPAIAEHTYTTGPGLEENGQVVNKDTYFLVHVVDALGNPSNVSGIIVTSVSNTDNNLVFAINGTDRTGVFNVTYTPTSASTHVITVRIVGSNLEISGSPFTVVIQLPCSEDPCGPGFECVGFNCIDVNECLDLDKCNATTQKCVNLPGSYYCKDLACPGNCNGHGICQEGTCVCDNPYTGPGCENVAVPLTLVFNHNFPSVKITANSKTFEISITEIRELNIRSEIVQSVPIPPLKFTLDNITNTWNYSLTPVLSTSVRSTLTVTFFHYVEPFFIQFAGINASRPANTLKMAATVASWPFKSPRNRLALVTTSTVVQDPNACFLATETIHDPNENLIWIKDEIEKQTLYGQYLQNAVVDGRNTEMINQYNHSAKEALLILPHFYDAASLDPDFSVLVDPIASESEQNEDRDKSVCDPAITGDEKKKKNIVIPIVATICSVIGVAMIVAAVMFMKSRQQKNATMQRLQSARSRSVTTSL